MSAVASPAKGNRGPKAPAAICNRCIPRINENLAVLPCHGFAPPPLAVKCSRCKKARHKCVAVEPVIWPALRVALSARAALARGVSDGVDENEEAALREAAKEAGQALIDKLSVLDRNRNRNVGDRAGTLRRAAGAAHGGSDDLQLELQSIRRGILGLNEGLKLLLNSKDVDTSTMDEVLGVDARASSSSEDDDDDDDDDDAMEDDE